VEQYRFEARVHGEQQVETSATTSTLAHIQQFAVASTTETESTLVGRADVEWHVMTEDSVVEQATAKEITHHDVEVDTHATIISTVMTRMCADMPNVMVALPNIGDHPPRRRGRHTPPIISTTIIIMSVYH